MKCSTMLLQLALGVVTLVSYSSADVSKDKRQVGKSIAGQLDTEEDRETAATGFASAGLGSSKYFQYAHQPAHDHYEFGHRKGNEHHFIERHEKAHPHAGEFKTKVRWGDKHGGYGEHYWDYNHAGHGGDGGEETQQQAQYADYDGAGSQEKQRYVVPSQQQLNVGRTKRQPNNPNEDVEFIDETRRFLSEIGATGRHGGNYRWEPSVERSKRTPEISDFVYDPNTGRVFDQKTGRAYVLTPVAA